VIEYQTQQSRLFPYLASCFVYKTFGDALLQDYVTMMMATLSKSEPPQILAAMGAELHGISSAAKAVSTWTAQAAIDECRQARTARVEKDWTRNWRQFRMTAYFCPLYFKNCPALIGLLTIELVI
jgi:hypothetical protein